MHRAYTTARSIFCSTTKACSIMPDETARENVIRSWLGDVYQEGAENVERDEVRERKARSTTFAGVV